MIGFIEKQSDFYFKQDKALKAARVRMQIEALKVESHVNGWEIANRIHAMGRNPNMKTEMALHTSIYGAQAAAVYRAMLIKRILTNSAEFKSGGYNPNQNGPNQKPQETILKRR